MTRRADLAARIQAKRAEIEALGLCKWEYRMNPTPKTTAESLQWSYELDPKVTRQVAHYVDALTARIAELEAKVKELRAALDAGDKLIAAQRVTNAAQAELIKVYQEQRGEYPGRVN
jgi:hypothetical protein